MAAPAPWLHPTGSAEGEYISNDYTILDIFECLLGKGAYTL